MGEHSSVPSRYSSLHVLAVLLSVSLGVTACAKLDGTGPGLGLADASNGGKPAGPPGLGSSETGKPASLQDLAKRHADAPGDARVAVRYARLLKKSGRTREALKVLETAALNGSGEDRTLLVERGLLAL